MIRPIDWLDRTWSFDLPVGAFPALLERLRGTPLRAAALIDGVSDRLARAHVRRRWCAKEHIGHLDDLHRLDTLRLRQFLNRVPTLAAADLTNRRTESAGHASAPASELLARFRRHRLALVSDLETVTAADLARTAIHPRLRRPIRLIDWLQFVADHDDHHLALARAALHRRSRRRTPHHG